MINHDDTMSPGLPEHIKGLGYLADLFEGDAVFFDYSFVVFDDIRGGGLEDGEFCIRHLVDGAALDAFAGGHCLL